MHFFNFFLLFCHVLCFHNNTGFQNEGDLVIGQNSYQYVYDIIADTHNNITLQSFSSEAESDMVGSDGRYFALFRRYNKYYGRPDYANEWVTAAFSGTTTDLLDGNAKFDDYDGEGKAGECGNVCLLFNCIILHV